MLLSESEIKSVCDQLLSYTKANDAEVSVGSEDYSQLRFAANGFTTSGRRESVSAGVTVWIDRKAGSASANDLSPESLRAAVEQAEQLARLAPEDKEYMPTLGPGVYPVILEAQAADDLIRLGFDARSADEGRSPYSAPGGKTRLGQQIFDERLNYYSDPWHPELPGSAAAQGGIPAQKIHFVRNGVLENLHYSRYWAKENGKEPTPGPVNSILESSTPPVSVEHMIKTMDRGLLLSRFW